MAAVLVLAASGVAAQVTPPRNGDEFQVNGYTTGFQLAPDVAVDGSGHYVVVWDGAGPGDDAGIFGRRYRSSGEALGPQFQINSVTASDQYFPTVGADNAGNFVVVWQSLGGDGDGYGVFARRFGPDGTPLGPQFQVNGFTAGHQLYPDVAVAPDGSFVVAWDADYQDGDYSSIVARRFNSAGMPLAAEFQVNTFYTGYQTRADGPARERRRLRGGLVRRGPWRLRGHLRPAVRRSRSPGRPVQGQRHRRRHPVLPVAGGGTDNSSWFPGNPTIR